MVDITTIPLEELEKDLQDSRNDISACEIALTNGITSYSQGSVNKHFVDVITKELERRKS